ETLQELERNAATAPPAEKPASGGKEALAERKEKNKIDRKKKNRISYLECEIAKLEKRMQELETVLSAPGEGDDIYDLTRTYLECKRSLDAMTEEWGTLID
ncbi:MAG: hypothetical protein J5871_04380, partial [Bacteroidales bacterium]|nr:hypothetical protein [Bacteroidales bacterium]